MDNPRNPAPALKDVIQRLDGLLDPASFSDYCPNGLQVPGPASVATVVTGVSAHAQLLQRAAEQDADLVLVHHGLFWRGQALEVTSWMHRRLRILYANQIALAAYHLPLDAHPEHGNNALLARALGLTDLEPFAGIGIRGVFGADGVPVAEFTERLRLAVGGRDPLHLAAGPERISSAGVVTGAGTDHLLDAHALGLDAFVTGEPAERAYGLAHDCDVHFYAAGHYATETFGVRSLGELLAAEFGVRHVFVDVPNPI